jgi:hypothetical protein
MPDGGVGQMLEDAQLALSAELIIQIFFAMRSAYQQLSTCSTCCDKISMMTVCHMQETILPCVRLAPSQSKPQQGQDPSFVLLAGTIDTRVRDALLMTAAISQYGNKPNSGSVLR